MKTIADVMTPDPATLSATDTIADAAKLMRDEDIGDVIVTREGDGLTGIVTDRDLVIRALADGRAPEDTQLGEIASADVVTVSPGDPFDEAVTRMREKKLRRLPVVDESGALVGIVSLGDLAEERDPDSALGEISAAPPDG